MGFSWHQRRTESTGRDVYDFRRECLVSFLGLAAGLTRGFVEKVLNILMKIERIVLAARDRTDEPFVGA